MARKIFPAAAPSVLVAAAAYAAARAALEVAESAKASAGAELLAALRLQGTDCVDCGTIGKVTVAAGRTSVKVTDPTLQAEIKLLQERGVASGRAAINVGDPYPILRK